MNCSRPATFTLSVACSCAASEPVTITARSIGRSCTRAIRTVRALAGAIAGFGSSDFEQDASNVAKVATIAVEIGSQRFISLTVAMDPRAGRAKNFGSCVLAGQVGRQRTCLRELKTVDSPQTESCQMRAIWVQ
ncbi:MAG: hypothetical protein DME26_19130 [Verrucomicrobia bacterium]|nr:MAG: hypothetical protein DME26_19130 [Verrucomicrobiota bacterium]